MFQKHIHKVKFCPSANDFTQALLVTLVTNIMSDMCVCGWEGGVGEVFLILSSCSSSSDHLNWSWA